MTVGPLRRIVLETSLKPFVDLTAAGIRDTCATMLAQWEPLHRDAERLAVLFWTGDGDELIRWRGEIDDTLDWARYNGHCSLGYGRHPGDPAGYQQAVPYRDPLPDLRYRHLQDIIATFKHLAASAYGKELACGTTIDPGPEFIHSKFKFEEHPEILTAGRDAPRAGGFPFVIAYARLHADQGSYAGWPGGIPEGTSLGTFLGRQARLFCEAIGFDYLWLSNGMGYSHYPWAWLGETFDGQRFGCTDAVDEAARVVGFWSDWRAEAPDLPLEVRGTNYPVGFDLACDAAPHRRIESIAGLAAPPVNPPWGSRDLGMEMASYLSRIAHLPGDHFDFRAYINDPWFWPNPWWDYYRREAFDIYAPLSCGRVTADGEVQAATSVAFLTIDTELGELNPETAIEVIPHVREALRTRPDAPGPLVWVYPYDERQADFTDPDRAALAWFGDAVARQAIGQGVPLNTVVSTTALQTVEVETWRDSILFCLLPREGEAAVPRLLELLDEGVGVVFYGPVTGADPAILQRLGLAAAEPLAGELILRLADGEHPLYHDPVLGAGPICAVPSGGGEGPEPVILASAGVADDERVYLMRRGKAAWFRGSLPLRLQHHFGRAVPLNKAESYDPQRLLPNLLWDLGLGVQQLISAEDGTAANLFIKRHDNGFWFCGHKPDASVVFELALPDGVPVCCELQTRIEDGLGWYFFDRTFHRECRVFVRQETGLVACKELLHPSDVSRRLQITGLDDATVTVYPPKSCGETLGIDGDVTAMYDEERGLVQMFGVTGTVTVTW